jgi:hypothetical protein
MKIPFWGAFQPQASTAGNNCPKLDEFMRAGSIYVHAYTAYQVCKLFSGPTQQAYPGQKSSWYLSRSGQSSPCLDNLLVSSHLYNSQTIAK